MRMTKEEKKLIEDLEFRIKELERVVRELIEYKENVRIEKAEIIDWKRKPIWIEIHDYKFD